MADDDGYPYDMDLDAALEAEEQMYEEMYEQNIEDMEDDYQEPDDIEKEMIQTALGDTPASAKWPGKPALYSPPMKAYTPAQSAAVEDGDGDNFESTRPIGHTSTGQLHTFASPLATKSALYNQFSSTSYLHDMPQEGDTQLTTVLEDGSRFFLRARKKADATADTQARRRPAPGSLLSMSMENLSYEADKLQRHILTSKKKNVIPESNAPLLANENSLWVDKYSPRLFSQLLSSEKTNREVLKALKQWDPFVFGSKLGQQVKQVKGDSRPFLKVILLCGPPGTGKTTIAHVAAEHCGYRPMEMNASDDRSVDALRETIGRAVTTSTLDKDKRPNCIILDEIDGIDGRGPIDALVEIIKAPLKVEKKGKRTAAEAGKAVGSFALTRPLICICNDLFSPQLRELRKHAQIFVFSSPMEMRLVQRLRNVCVTEGIQVQSGVLSMLCAATGFDIRSSINTLQFASLKSKSEKANKGSASSNSHSDVGGVLMAMLSSGLKDVDKDLFQVWKEIFWLKESARAFTKKKYLGATIDNKLEAGYTSSSAGSEQPISSSSRGGKISGIDVASLRKIRDSEFGSNAPGSVKANGDNSGARNISGHAMDVIDSVIGFGDNQLIIDGLFENYLGIRYQDPAMSRTSTSVDWLCDSDLWAGKFGGGALSDGFQTMKYVPVAAGAVHLLCSAGTRPALNWPKKESNMRFSRQQRDLVVQSVIEGAPQHNLSLRQKLIVAMEVIPFLMDIISPHIRPAPMQTLSQADQKQLKDASSAMASCGIRYEYQSSVLSSMLNNQFNEGADRGEGTAEDDQPPSDIPGGSEAASKSNGFPPRGEESSLFQLTPAINELLGYPPVAELSGRRRLVSPEMKNMFYVETQKALIAAKRHADSPDMDVDDVATAPADVVINSKLNSATATLPALVPVTDRGSGMFFSKSNINKKRALEQSKDGQGSSATAAAAKKQAVRFKFSQGFSAAVRRPVKISEFL